MHVFRSGQRLAIKYVFLNFQGIQVHKSCILDQGTKNGMDNSRKIAVWFPPAFSDDGGGEGGGNTYFIQGIQVHKLF